MDTDVDPNFEPQIRARSNTWPLRPNRELLEAQSGSPVSDESVENHREKDPLGLNTKKSGSRRNAWGNLSYADLITKAIQSSPEKRLTLSQIYDWMVQNVPYFKDKGDSTSSAGWKNSIRHNLSLHSRFMRIQNEGTGKSSWWVINPDAKPGKTPRRRAGSMETKNYEKKRGRVKKKVEVLRAALEKTGSPYSTSDDFLDSFGDFRPRASSNASSCGRLSPIQALGEPDLHDNQVPPMSPIPWGQEGDSNFGCNSDGFTDQLVDSLVGGMKLDPNIGLTGSEGMDIVGNGLPEPYMQNSSPNDLTLSEFNQNSTFNSNGNYNGQFANLPAPPPYPDQLQSQSPQPQPQPQAPVLANLERVAMSNRVSGLGMPQGMGIQQNMYSQQQQHQQQQQDLFQDEVGQLGSSNQLNVNTSQLSSPRSPQQTSPQGYGNNYSPQSQNVSPSSQQISPSPRQLSPQCSPALSPLNQRRTALQQQLQQQQQSSNDSILRAALTQGGIAYGRANPNPQMNMPYNNVQRNGPIAVTSTPVMNGNHLSPSNAHIGHMPNQRGHLQMTVDGGYLNMGHNPEVNVPIDIDVENWISGVNESEIDRIIKEELTLEGNLDFNFDTQGSGLPLAGGQKTL